jgi:hypothetical protein
MWVPSVVLTVLVVGSVDLSTLVAARSYPNQAACERDVRALVRAARSLYPGLKVNFAGCVPAK